VRLQAGLLAARATGAVTRLAGRGGTSLPGKVLMRAEPHAISRLASRLPRGSVVVSATNGKTTTAAMVASILGRTGTRLVHNRAGANMAGGVAAALAAASRRGGDMGLFEVDEFWLGPVAAELEPRAVLLGNLFRDQLDRYGELEIIADRWAEIVAGLDAATALVLNADDPLVADLGRHHGPLVAEGHKHAPQYFGVQDDALALPELQHASDSKHCRRCGTAYVYEAAYLAHLGRYACPNCGARRPEPAVSATDVELRGIRSAAFTLNTPDGERRIELPLPGLYNVYNALGAAALCLRLGVPLDDVAAGLAAVEPAFGRAETIALAGRPTSILLIKNPAGANEVLRTLALEGAQLDLLGVLNDRTADGRDVSWVWDADWEIIAPHVRRLTCAGTRAAELALRLKYAGVPPERLEVVDELEHALDRALAAGDGPLYALPTYTALLELQDLLARRGHAQEYWR
jgi:UDP-N-acetylmuramyl tripeptide synthase